MIKYQIGNVIYVDFTKTGILTKRDIDNIDKRVSEINEALNLCSEDGRDDDVVVALQRELDQICLVLENSLKKTRKQRNNKKKKVI
jgi:hypothetical protein